MKLRVTHLTRYEYTQHVSFSPHTLYLRPRENATQRLLRHSLNISPNAKVCHGYDAFENPVAWAHFWDRAYALNFRNEFEVETLEANPFDFILRQDAAQLPIAYHPAERLALAPYLAPTQPPLDTHARLLNWLAEHYVDRPAATLPFLTGLCTILYCHLDYKRRDEPGVQPPLRTLELGSGSCRDYATLFTELCRALGFAARNTTGYLYTHGDDAHASPGAMHAWTELYLPGAGWRGIDPTHGLFTTEAYIPVAHAPDLSLISPVQGAYYSSIPVGSTLTSRVLVDRIH